MAGGRGVDHGPQINNCVTFVFYKEKICIRETLNLLIDADSITDRKTHRNGLFLGEGGSQIKLKKIRGGVQKLPKTYGLHFFYYYF